MSNPFAVEVDGLFLRKFLQAIYDMREAQNDYFTQPGQYRLKVARAKEAIVDQYMKEAITAGYVTQRKQNSSSNPTLFT